MQISALSALCGQENLPASNADQSKDPHNPVESTALWIAWGQAGQRKGNALKGLGALPLLCTLRQELHPLGCCKLETGGQVCLMKAK